jgi:small GTP-binding protein
VVGNEAVGKTSLLRYLIDGRPRDAAEARTPGIVQHERIRVQAWSPHECEVQLNIWDFGGQEMLRGTHRFFLTERSLYLLVLEDRRQDDRSVYDWMKTIRNRGGESPIIVVINKSDNGKQDYRPDERGLRETYGNIVTFVRTSCNDDAWAANSIAELRREIVQVVMGDRRLRHVLDGIPGNWLQIKQEVSALAHGRAILTHADFVGLCRHPGGGEEPVASEDEQRALLQLLHQLGTIVAHGLPRDASAARREVSLLEPNWLTEAVYTIVDRARMVEQNGEFLSSQLAEWLDPGRYPPQRHEFILDMMKDPDIGLCFPVPAAHGERYLVPEALPANRPYLGNRPEDVLRFRYGYGYLPPGLIPRLIVESSNNVKPDLPRWRSGVILATRGCEVLVIADPDARRVDLEVSGQAALRRAALNVVLNHLERVHALNPEAEPLALVPLPEQPDQQVRYEHLLELERRYGSDHAFLPEGAGREYTVRELLEGVRRDTGAPPPREPQARPEVEPSAVPDRIMLCGIFIAALAALILLRNNWPVAVLVVLILLLLPVIWAFLRNGGQLSGEQLLSVYRMGIGSVGEIRRLVTAVPQSAPQQADATDAPDMARATPAVRARQSQSGARAKGAAAKRAANRS